MKKTEHLNTRGLAQVRPKVSLAGYACAALVAFLGDVQNADAAEWHVAPDGRAENSGSVASPWDLMSTLAGKQKIEAGDNVWLKAGKYIYPRTEKQNVGFEVKLQGSAAAPIQVRGALGERVTIVGGLAVIAPAAHVWIRDLEITDSAPQAVRVSKLEGSHPGDLPKHGAGLEIRSGAGCKYINLIIHENFGGGVGFWSPATDSEIYGCIIYDNGWQAPDRMHGHCIYTQNKDGWKTISNCILSTPWERGQQTVQAYGSSRAFVNNFLFEENVAYERGRFLIGGGQPSRNIRVLRNYLHNVDLQLGYSAAHNENCEVRGNVISNGELRIQKFTDVIQEGNLIVRKPSEAPPEPKIVWLPNKYDPDRAHLVIYNWGAAGPVQVPAAPFLRSGDSFRLLNPQKVFGEPVLSGECRGGTIEVPVEGGFGVYVVTKASPR